MARQANTPVQFGRSKRRERATIMTSGRAGKVVPVGYFPLLNGDAASGKVGIDIELAEMPRPLLNGVIANVQAWVVPKMAHPQFGGFDDYMHAQQGTQIRLLGSPDRDPASFFDKVEDGTDITTVAASDFMRTLGIHMPSGTPINTDLIDAFTLIYNFRLAAHSSKLPVRSYASEDLLSSTALPPAFWPSSKMNRIVPDYESALITGELNLDVTAGRLRVNGIGTVGNGVTYHTAADYRGAGGEDVASGKFATSLSDDSIALKEDPANPGYPNVYAEMAGETVAVSLADIDKARVTQSFAKLRAAYAGNDATGFDNDDTIIAQLMSGYQVPMDEFKRPILLDSKMVSFGFTERFATDAANLDASVSQGRVSTMLSLNIPAMACTGTVIFTVEVMPEQLYEAQSDEWLHITDPAEYPDALRDVQRIEPVDMVLNRRIDARHTTETGLFGYEPMNDVWNRDFTRLGGSFFQEDPSNPFTEQRSAIWQTSIVDPEFTADHWLCPEDFPHDVFSDTQAPAFEIVARHDVAISGLTQIGDVLEEDNSNFGAVRAVATEE